MKKKLLVSLSSSVGKCRSLMALLLTCATMDGVWAQWDSPWTGETLPVEGGEFYLYNKVGNGFLLGANSWGTQASLGQPGLLCTLEVMPDGKYAIKTMADKYLKDDYIDKDKNGYDFIDSNQGDNVYEFSLFGNGSYLYYAGSGTVLSRTDQMTDNQWILVSKEQRIRALEKATEEQGVDATFYITGANFDRSQPSDWQESHNGGSLTLIGPDRKDGSTNSCTEAYDNETFDVYQTLTGLKNGYYLVSCQGYYRPGGNVNDTGARNAVLYANADEVPLQLLADDGKGIPNNMDQAADAFLAGRYVGNEVRTVVADGTLRIGVKKKAHIGKDWAAFDTFRLTYLGEANASEIFQNSLKMLEALIGDFTSSGATAIVGELQQVYDENKNASGDGVEAAQKAVSDAMSLAQTVQVDVESLVVSIETAKSLFAKVEDGTYVLSTAGKNALNQGMAEAEKALKETSMSAMSEQASAHTEKLNAQVKAAELWIGMIYPLNKAKALADAMTGFVETDAYKQVVSDLDDAALTYERVVADVAALNLACRDAMTVDFLAKATADAPIDMTSFIRNPNIYQIGTIDDKDKRKELDGWTIAEWGSVDNKNLTLEINGDTELLCSSWSGNVDNSIGKAHYYALIGGDVNLPDGLYRLEAATYITRQPDAVVLYASTDNVDMVMANFNGNKAVYDQAVGLNDGTTTSLEIQVRGGRLYFGVKGKAIVGGLGQQWLADNFRLYYIGAPDVEPKDIKVSKAGMATYYSANAFTVPEGLTGGVVTNEDAATVAVDWRYPAGSTVPGHTGVILKGAVGDYKAEYSVANVASPENNLLDGTIEAATIADAGYKYYKLADGEKGLGFYFAVEGGSSIMNGANKAYLALPENEAQEVNFLALDFGTTGITDTALAAEDVRVDVYTISGVLVRSGVKASEALDGLSKGIYIVNGKKILK